MNRTDRLLAMVMLLQSRRVITAAQLAEHFGITERTVYRDLVALAETGVPVVGEAGVGYSLSKRSYHLPPVMFSPHEALALVTGGLLSENMTDASMREATRSAVGKVVAVLPSDLQDRIERLGKTMRVQTRTSNNNTVPLGDLQMALAQKQVLQLHYHGAARDQTTQRTVEPLGLVFYLDHWHLFAWCRLRDDVRDFRVDRIQQCQALPETAASRPFDIGEYFERCMAPDPDRVAVIELPVYLLETTRRFWGPMLMDEQSTADKKVQVRLNYGSEDMRYIAAWLLGLADQVRILEPTLLRKKLASLAEKTMQHHQNPDPGSV